jgi:hypothetical protein
MEERIPAERLCRYDSLPGDDCLPAVRTPDIVSHVLPRLPGARWGVDSIPMAAQARRKLRRYIYMYGLQLHSLVLPAFMASGSRPQFSVA